MNQTMTLPDSSCMWAGKTNIT